MTSAELNNFDIIKEKTSSLNAQKILNINNLMHNQTCEEKKKDYCNDEMKKHVSILFIILFLLTLVGASVVFFFITFTNKFNEGIVENLILRNGSKSMEWWQDSPIQPLVKIYIFNYTNIDDYLKGRADKIKVEDVGPYVYKEFGSRVHLSYSDDHKITFFDNKTVKYVPELSDGRSENDLVYVPNIPLLAALTKLQDMSYVENTAFDLILRTTWPKEFQYRTVKEYMFGYSDDLINMTPNMKADKVGLMSGRKGVSTDNLTVHTGEDSLDNLGRIHAMNGEAKLNIWDTEECNEIVGTDGSQFPPHLMNKEDELKIFLKSFCRTLTLKYEREVTVLNGIPAWRYKVPEGEFSSSLKNPKNKCFCDAEIDSTCPPDGVFDASKCVDGIPLLVSYPHFFEGNESLLTPFEGLKPNKKAHETVADIHPRMAFPIGGASRLQMNFKVKSRKISFFFKQHEWYTKLPKDIILPIFWFEVTAGEIPPDFQALVFHTTQSANATYLAIQYGSLVAAFVFFLLLCFTSYIYLNRLTGKSPEKIDNREVIVSFKPNLYPNNSSQVDQITSE